MATWIAEGHAESDVTVHDARWQEIGFDSIVVHHVYLSPDSSKQRRHCLLELAGALSASPSPVLVLGDFNLAPAPEDGWYGEQFSAWTKPGERAAFTQLLATADLLDTTSQAHTRCQSFTFERPQRGKLIRFRCDLALASRTLADHLEVHYDHSVRLGSVGFTDHSAIVIDVDVPACGLGGAPIAAEGPTQCHQLGAGPIGDAGHASVAEASHKTAIRRTGASQIARKLYEDGILQQLSVGSILDYGCGWGEDVKFYRACGFEADGYDREARFGFSSAPGREYDLVTLVFVINVLPTLEHRQQAIGQAASHVRSGGHLLVAARSERAVNSEARKRGWQKCGDGYLSDPRKNTFQKGISPEEVAWLLGNVGFPLVRCSLQLSTDVSWLLARRQR